MSVTLSWLRAFVFTQLIEVPIYRRVAPVGGAAAFLATAFTHPIVWFLFPALQRAGLSYWGMVALAELFAVVAEAVWLWRLPARLREDGAPPLPFARALGASLLANAVSAGLALLARATFGAP